MTGELESRSKHEFATGHFDSRVWRIVAVVFFGPLMTQIDATVINVALPTISQDLRASIDSAQWIISGYLLAVALTLPLNAWLAHRMGPKRLYLWSLSAFTLASFLCGIQTTINGLILARVIQGMAGGLLTPMAQMTLARAAGKHIARVMGYTAIPVLMAPLLGPVLAGAILKYAVWPWLFYINLPIGILAVTSAALVLPNDEVRYPNRPFDCLGFLLISPALAALLYGLDHASQREGRVFLLSGVTLAGVFVWHAIRRDTQALIDVGLFRNRDFSIATTTQFVSNGANYAGQMLVPLFLIAGCGISPAKAGWMLAPMGLGLMFANPMLGFMTERFGYRIVPSVGTILSIVGTLPLLWMAQNQLSPVLLAVSLFARGAGQGAVFLPAISAAYVSVARDQLALASTASNIVQRLGGPLGTTMIAIVLSHSSNYVSAVRQHEFTAGFVALIGLQLILLTSASRLPRRLGD
jgi:EmrB/QacA subfamily drug resistance transporter